MLEDRLSDVILTGDIKLGSTVIVDYNPDTEDLTFNEEQPTATLSEPA